MESNQAVGHSTKFLLVGHISLDRRDGLELKGGPPQYQIPPLLALNIDNLDILTSTHDTSLIPTHDKIRVINIPSTKTSIFEFYRSEHTSEDDRELVVPELANPITSENIQKLENQYTGVIVSGIAGEVSLDTCKSIIRNLTNAIVFIDAQTLIRSLDEENHVVLSKITQSDLNELDHPQVVIRGSRAELNHLSEYKFRGLLIRTNSGIDVEIMHENKYSVMNLPGEKTSIVDVTGSGDIFLACFAALYLKTSDIEDSIEQAHDITEKHLYVQGIPTFDQSLEIIRDLKI